jgi:NADPH:quinone reductase-like Zn-dependent oxidoreductase
MPFWTGCDIAGDVTQVGAAVSGVEIGDRVAVNPNISCGRCEFCRRGEHSLCVRYGILGEHTPGGLAEYVKVDGRHVVELPDAIRYEDAAAFILVNMTAWRMLVTQARLRAGEDLLVIGVGGGVSSAAVQIGKLCGARVWVTSGSDDKLERARALGADECINHAREDWVRVIGRKTGRRGMDVVLENVGAATWKGSIRVVAKGGRIVTCGATSGPIAETDIRLVFWKQISIIGSTMSNDAEFYTVMGQLFAGRLHAIVDTVMPLREGVEAQRRLAEGKQFGKIVLTP